MGIQNVILNGFIYDYVQAVVGMMLTVKNEEHNAGRSLKIRAKL